MATKYIKKASKTPETDDHKTQAAVQDILNDIAKRKEVAIKELNKKFDKYDGEVIVSKEKIEEAIKKGVKSTLNDPLECSIISNPNKTDLAKASSTALFSRGLSEFEIYLRFG